MADSRPDAIELLEADHLALHRLFEAYAALLAHGAPASRRQALAEQICMAITLHDRLEDDIFYPAARDAIGDDELMEEADAAHASTRDLVAQLLCLKPHDERYDAKLGVLGDCTARHVADERNRLFPRVRRSGLDLGELGLRMAERQRELHTVRDALREEAIASLTA